MKVWDKLKKIFFPPPSDEELLAEVERLEEENHNLVVGLGDVVGAKERLNQQATQLLLAVALHFGGELEIPVEFMDAANDPTIDVDLSVSEETGGTVIAVKPVEPCQDCGE